MAERLRWAILATGNIARTFARGLAKSETGELVAVGSRDLGKAEAFAAEFGGRGYGSYREAVWAPGVEAVYIASPHHMHAEDTKMCAAAGRHVLCEKPFTLDFESAVSAIAACKEADVMFCEAFMYRMHPQTVRLKELCLGGEMGRVTHVSAEFGFAAGRDWDNFRARRVLGGGALMDVGSYCVSMARMVCGARPVRHEYVIQRAGDGYDGVGTGFLAFEDDATASFSTAIHLNLQNRVVVYLDGGRIEVDSPWFCGSGLRIYRAGAEEPVVETFAEVDLYANEADVFARSLDDREVSMMTPEDTLENMRALDALRASAGLIWDEEVGA